MDLHPLIKSTFMGVLVRPTFFQNHKVVAWLPSLTIRKSIVDQTLYEKIKISWTLEISTINIYHCDVGNLPVLFWIYGTMFPFKVPHGGVNINKNRKFRHESQKMNSWKFLLFLGALFYLLWFMKITNSNFSKTY